MGDFGSSSPWIQVAYKVILVGFLLDTMAFAGGRLGVGDTVDALQVGKIIIGQLVKLKLKGPIPSVLVFLFAI